MTSQLFPQWGGIVSSPLNLGWPALAVLMMFWASLVAQQKRIHLPLQERQVWSLGSEDALEKEVATHSSILAWRIPWTEETGGLQSTGSKRAGYDWATNTTAIGDISGGGPQRAHKLLLSLFREASSLENKCPPMWWGMRGCVPCRGAVPAESS